MIQGKRTYITLVVLVAKEILSAFGISIPDESLSTAIDVALVIGAGVFRYLAKGK